MSLEDFRATLRIYRQHIGFAQEALAAELGLHPIVLSNKLNGTNKARLTQAEIKKIITLLVAGEALNSYGQVSDLLALLDLTPQIFAQHMWRVPPLNRLEGLPPASMPDVYNQYVPAGAPLPVPLTPIIGRDGDIAALCDLLRDATVRLVCLTGPGGVGKTRLALAVAHQLYAHFRDGVFFVPLAHLRDAALVAPALTQALGLPDADSQPALSQLRDWSRNKQALLVLDNFEQVVSAAALIADILTTAPQLTILVTSRASLRVYGEHEYSVPGLALPDLQQSPRSSDVPAPAVALFLQRAQAARRNFTLSGSALRAVQEICVRLDGLPLAIELAAARVKYFTPDAILARLDARFALLTDGAQTLPVRHQTLRNTLDWSYDLLDTAEQQLFRQLAAFVAGCTAETVAAICPAVVDSAVTTQMLAHLTDKSMLQVQAGYDGAPRFMLLETVRAYAQEKLAESAEAETLSERHALYFTSLAESANVELDGRHAAFWLARMEAERGNMRAALQWLLAHGRNSEAQRLGVALWWYRGMNMITAQHRSELALPLPL